MLLTIPLGCRSSRAPPAGGGPSSHSFAIILRPLTPSDRADISHTIGAIITSGWIKVDRSSTSDMGIMRVLAGPPGASAFTVTPVPARSFDQMTVED